MGSKKRAWKKLLLWLCRTFRTRFSAFLFCRTVVHPRNPDPHSLRNAPGRERLEFSVSSWSSWSWSLCAFTVWEPALAQHVQLHVQMQKIQRPRLPKRRRTTMTMSSQLCYLASLLGRSGGFGFGLTEGRGRIWKLGRCMLPIGLAVGLNVAAMTGSKW